jgi:hypothetical protein
MSEPILNFMHANFQVAFQEMQKEAHEINEAHGFNEPDALVDEFENWMHTLNFTSQEKFFPLVGMLRQARTGLKLMLQVSELAEALEGIRKGNKPDSHIPEFTAEEAELADAVIRIMNHATDNKCRLAEAIVAKQDYNRARPFRHGGKAF